MDTSQQRTAELYTKARTDACNTFAPWICQTCQREYPVTSLARICEDKHLELGDCVA